MIKEIFGKTLIATGITISAIPFLSAALFGLGILSLIWLKDQMTLIFSPASVNDGVTENYSGMQLDHLRQ